MYSLTPSDRCPRWPAMLKPASVHNCPCCGYPLGILANHNVASMTAARRVILMMLLGMAVGAMAFGASSVYDFTLNSIDGAPTPLSTFKGKVVLFINVASKCGYTPQYAGLEKLYEKYKDQGLVLVGVPANNFGGQEPGSNEEIKTFCSRNYNVTFPMMSKVSVKGADKTPLYQYLTDASANPKTAGEIKWNFTKFLIDKKGNVINRFESAVTPESADMVKAIEAALAQ